MGSPTTSLGRIFLVGPSDNAQELDAILSANSWLCLRSETPSGVLRRLRSQTATDLVILAPDTSLDSYAELCRDIKLDARTAFIPVIFIMPSAHTEGCTCAYEARADDCIQLPASQEEIVVRLSNALRVKRAIDMLEDATAVLTSLAMAIEGRDSYTHGHVERVSVYSVEIGKRVGVDEDGLVALRFGGIVHDIGKVAVPDSILNKPGKLDALEMEMVRRHPVIGHDILKPSRTFRDVLPIVRWHHERPNGTGYPDRLVGGELPLLPRVVAVADCFDALSTARPYRQAFPLSECRDILSTAAEKEDLDPSLVAVLFEILDERTPVLAGAQRA